LQRQGTEAKSAGPLPARTLPRAPEKIIRQMC